MRMTAGRDLFHKLFCIQADNHELLRAQYAAFQKQMPLLYIILSINSAAVAYSFRNVAPAALAIWTPVTLCAVCLTRLIIWLFRRHILVTDAMILGQLRLTNKLSVLISIVFCSWSLSLYPYGDAYMKGHVAFYMSLTEIAVIFCLMHLRSAALLSSIFVMVPFCSFFCLVDIPSFNAIAINLALVCCAMITVLFVYYRDFANLVESRKSLLEKQVETQRLSDENFRIANLDSLTGLPNRRSFFADLANRAATAETTGRDFAIAIVDLDGFKPINDTFGHSSGDGILIETSRRLAAMEACGIRFARLGGDEFAALLHAAASDEDLLDLGSNICYALRQPFRIGGSTVQLSSSVGIAKFSESGRNIEKLYEHADYALYCAKRGSKDTAVLFTPRHESEIEGSRVVENVLKQSDLDAELSLVFQPIISTIDGRPVSFEALARWHSPTLGVVPPATFIPAAERVGLISKITRILLRKAIATALTWPNHIRLSFNLSVQDICSPEGALSLIAIVNSSGIDPHRIDFEITETAVAQDFSQALRTVVALRALGAGISLDDFGTGFSSLSHLHRLPLDKLKVDKSFIDDIATNPVSYKIVRSLMALCADMELRCVIEGVETAEQEAILLKLGCKYIQGFIYSKPLTAAGTLRCIQEQRGLRLFL